MSSINICIFFHPEFFKLMNEVENEDLVFTLETIVDKFGEEMAPYALGLCQNLVLFASIFIWFYTYIQKCLTIFFIINIQAAAFWRCMNTAEAEDEADDPGALAAVGCLRAISTILESVSRLPHLFVQVEPTLLPIMRRMLSSDGQGIYSNASIWLIFLHCFYLFISWKNFAAKEDWWALYILLSKTLKGI